MMSRHTGTEWAFPGFPVLTSALAELVSVDHPSSSLGHKSLEKGASLFLQVSRRGKFDGPVNSSRVAEIFKLLVALAKQIESFVRGCCKDSWIQAAMTLTIVSVYVTSLGFTLELCRLSFCN